MSGNRLPALVTGEIIDSDAIQIGELYEKARTSLVESVRYQAECGRRLAAKKASMPHGQWMPWLEANKGALGFANITSTPQRLMRLAEEDSASTQNLSEAQAVQISRKTWGNDTLVTKYTGDTEWYTPAVYVDAARKTMGGIDLDPASNAIAQETVKAAEWYDAERDGLRQEWKGRVFLNPPYAYPLIAHFIEKLCHDVGNGTVTSAILLTNNSTDTRWWHQAIRMATAICFTLGRVNFYKGSIEAQPTNGQTFFYFGSDVEQFAREFGALGFVLRVSDLSEGGAP